MIHINRITDQEVQESSPGTIMVGFTASTQLYEPMNLTSRASTLPTP